MGKFFKNLILIPVMAILFLLLALAGGLIVVLNEVVSLVDPLYVKEDGVWRRK